MPQQDYIKHLYEKEGCSIAETVTKLGLTGESLLSMLKRLIEKTEKQTKNAAGL